jgi:ureidoglycolate dehydrogenase (NAD+)
VTVSWESLQRFACQLLCSAGVAEQEADLVASGLVWADLVGRHTHGVERLAIYLKRFRHGLISSPCNAEFIRHSETISTLRGNNGFGHYLGQIAISRPIEIAGRHGLGVVGVTQSNHFGAAAYYVQSAAEAQMIGLAFSNSTPQVAPYGGTTAVLGTNPFAFGAPTRSGQSVLVDFSTGAASGSMIRRATEAQKGIPEDILIDEMGRAVVDPSPLNRAVILPFGGAKGFCLGLMVEILSGVITGAGFSHEVASSYGDFDRRCNIGHLFMALDISRVMPMEEYYERMEMLVSSLKNSGRSKDVGEILIPGETRWRHYARQLAQGIGLDRRTIDLLQTLAAELKVSTPW